MHFNPGRYLTCHDDSKSRESTVSIVVRDYYTPETAAIVGERLASDIEYFGREFEDEESTLRAAADKPQYRQGMNVIQCREEWLWS